MKDEAKKVAMRRAYLEWLETYSADSAKKCAEGIPLLPNMDLKKLGVRDALYVLICGDFEIDNFF